MPEPQLTFNIETLIDRARALWHGVSHRKTKARVELFAKVSLRSKVTRGYQRSDASFDHTQETGLAIRVMRTGHDHAGFAAASGLSSEVVRWAMDTACSFGAQASALAPSPSDVVEPERWDLDAEDDLPSEDALTAGVMSRPNLEWVEAGTTLEVLIGAEGWLAARRRHRVWALDGRDGARIVAQRGFAGWGHLLEDACPEASAGADPNSGDLGVVVLTPDAASPVVASLVESFHGAGAPSATRSGPGWNVADDPSRSEGLAGGTFDDAGFPATTRVLATDGLWVGKLGGPGTLRRGSFREPPTESATNLSMPSGETNLIPGEAVVARRCRVLRLSNEIWVLELDLNDVASPLGRNRVWVRVRPHELLEACAGRLGGSRVTSGGPIVPGLLFEGLSARVSKNARI